jgi:phosphoribosylaminoimidazolecarboxamide formyltransferase/IMP cyclohydrolase
MPPPKATIRRALISVTDKTGIVEFTHALAKLGVEIISTGGTFRALKAAGISSLREVADVTEFPEMLDGRVKTIHPRIAGGILAMRSKPEHMDAIAAHGIPPIDLVVVNLYQFEKVAADPNAPLEELIEHIDIGGPTLIRAAAKNWQDVAVVTSPNDYPAIVAELSSNSGSLLRETHWRLATKAFAATAAYDRAISRRLAPEDNLDVLAPLRFTLRYGENPHQTAALYAAGPEGIAGAEQLQGKELSFNNLVDLDAAWQLAQEFEHPASAIIKHTNPCGCAESATLAESYRRAFEADPISPFGGVLAFNRTVDAETAEEIVKILMDAVAAPDYSPEALSIFTARKNLRLLRVKMAPSAPVLKSISGGYLIESPDIEAWSRKTAQVKTHRAPTDEEWTSLAFAMKVAKHVKSNAIVFARNGQTIGIGAGQTSRVDSVKVGAMRAILPLKGTVLASDAFFPFPDGVEEAAKHGVTAIIQPGGSLKDGVVIEAADRLGLAMVFTGVRHFRH